ncbi:MAG: hypothetical protein MI976_22135 [Pseudomonadales bacterium]|nr:hypothetical protein [Pseudomonadales bacterium]
MSSLVEAECSTRKPVIYTAVFGGYDMLPMPPEDHLHSKYRFILFVDEPITCPGWEVIVLNIDNPLSGNRHCKMFPWDYFDARNSFYIDGHVRFGNNFHKLSESLLNGDSSFSVFRHRMGGIVADELVRCIDNRKISKKDIVSILKNKIDFGDLAVECGFIYRVHEDSLVRDHADKWWEYFNNVCARDQVFVNQAANDVGLNIDVIDACFNDSNEFSKVGVHRNARFLSVLDRLKHALYICSTGLTLR